MQRLIFGILLIVALVTALQGTSRALPAELSALYAATGDGYQCTLTVSNGTEPGIAYHIASISMDTALLHVNGVEAPAGWYGWADAWQTYWAIHESMPPPNWYDGIGPGEQLSGFVFTSPELPTGLPCLVSAFTDTERYYYRAAVVPEPVPEPSTIPLMAGWLGLGSVSLLRRRFRR